MKTRMTRYFAALAVLFFVLPLAACEVRAAGVECGVRQELSGVLSLDVAYALAAVRARLCVWESVAEQLAASGEFAPGEVGRVACAATRVALERGAPSLAGKAASGAVVLVVTAKSEPKGGDLVFAAQRALWDPVLLAHAQAVLGRHRELLRKFEAVQNPAAGQSGMPADATELERAAGARAEYALLADEAAALAWSCAGLALGPGRGPGAARYDEADIPVLQQALRMNEEDAYAAHALAVAQMDLGRFDLAAVAAGAAMELDASLPGVFALRGNAYRELGRVEDAVADFDEALRRDPDDQDAHLHRGMLRARQGRFEDALSDFDVVLKREPDNALALNRRGLVLARLGRLDQAMRDYERAVELDPSLAEDAKGRGRIFMEFGQYEKAVEDFSRALKKTPEDMEALALRGEGLLELGREAEGVADLEKAAKALGTEDAGSRLFALLGRAHAQLGDNEQAVTAYSTALEAEPDNAAALAGRGRALAALGRAQQAEADFARAVLIDASNSDILAQHARVLMQLARFDQAAEAWGLVLRAAPDRKGAYAALGESLWRTGDYVRAAAALDRAVKREADAPSGGQTLAASLWKRGDCLRALKRPGEALTLLDRALGMMAEPQQGDDSAREYAAVLNVRARTLADLQRFDRAVTDFERAAALDPTTGVDHLGRGLAYAAAGRHDRALHDLDIALSAKKDLAASLLPQDLASALLARARALRKTNNASRALADLDRIIRLAPASRKFLAQVHNERGLTHAALGLRREAMDDYNHAVELSSNLPSSESSSESLDTQADYYNRGLLFKEFGQYGKAAADFSRVLQDHAATTQTGADALLARGECYLLLGDHARALTDLEAVLARHPDSAEAYALRGRVRQIAGDLPGAVADFDKALGIAPNNPVALNNRGQAYMRIGRYNEAVDDFTRALDEDASFAEAYANRGEAYKEAGTYDRAQEDFDRALLVRPGIARWHFLRGVCKAATGRLDDAIEDYSRAIKLDDRFAEFRVYRGTAYYNQQRSQPMCQDFRRALDLGDDKGLMWAWKKGLCQ